jgi:Uma2 family endonuclease
MYQLDPPFPPIEIVPPPTQDGLLYDDDEPMETYRHSNQDYKGPDVFAVVDVPVKERKCWVVWEEGKAPDLVIELLSPSTVQTDKTTKKLIYQNQLRVPEYIWYDPFNPNDFAGFGLSQSHHVPIPLDEQGRLSSQSLGLLLVR